MHQNQASRCLNDGGSEYMERRYGACVETPQCNEIVAEDAFVGVQNQHDQRFFGLINPIDEAEANRLIQNPAYVMQQKFNGRRILIRKQDNEINGINKRGLIIGLPETVAKDIGNLPGNFILDGECIGDVFHAFDLLMFNNQDLRPNPYHQRLTALMNLLMSAQHRFIKYATTAFTANQKAELHSTLWIAKQEGVVFKRLDAPYTPGPDPGYIAPVTSQNLPIP